MQPFPYRFECRAGTYSLAEASSCTPVSVIGVVCMGVCMWCCIVNTCMYVDLLLCLCLIMHITHTHACIVVDFRFCTRGIVLMQICILENVVGMPLYQTAHVSNTIVCICRVLPHAALSSCHVSWLAQTATVQPRRVFHQGSIFVFIVSCREVFTRWRYLRGRCENFICVYVVPVPLPVLVKSMYRFVEVCNWQSHIYVRVFAYIKVLMFYQTHLSTEPRGRNSISALPNICIPTYIPKAWACVHAWLFTYGPFSIYPDVCIWM